MKNLLTCLCLAGLLLPAAAQIPDGYRLETVTPPKGAVTLLGLCHQPDGTLAIATWEGDVWERRSNTWTRFAENLMEPNGIHYDVAEDAYYVAQKPELTRLVDLDKDGVCDRYECITDAFGVSGEYHEYHFGPVADSLGRKYASLNLGARGTFTVPDGKEVGTGGGNMSYNAPWRGWVYRSDRRGHFQPLASGFRSPCGIGISPDDQLFITDNQGDWVGDCCLYHVREGNFYGHPASLPGRPDFDKEKVLSMTAADFARLRTLPAVWLPREVIANSPGSPVWDTTEGKFGPFAGQMFIGDQRQSNYFRADVEEVDGDLQGWCIDFLRGTASGPVKMSFDPQGRLWSAQVGRGWSSKGGKRSALQYAVWDGETVPFAIHSASLTRTGFDATFTRPLAKAIVPKVSSWHHHYYSTYGSPRVDETEREASQPQLSDDGLTLHFEVPLTPGKVYAIQFPELQSADGAALDFDTLYYTLNKLRPAKEPRTGRNVGWDLVGSGWHRNDGRRPLPPVVEPLPEAECRLAVPEGATVLDASRWSNPAWTVDADGVMVRGKGNNETREAYGDARIHLEFRFEQHEDPQWQGQLYGNSGVFLMSGYELQVVNSFENPTFADGHCGAIYGQHPPWVNACRPPGEWQSYDILMKAPIFGEEGEVEEPLRVTVYHNGHLIQDDAWVYGEVGRAYQRHGKRPLMLQDHKGTGVSFRNLWIVPDVDYDSSLPAFRRQFGRAVTKAASVKPDPKPAFKPITVLPASMVRDMDQNADGRITVDEFLGYRKPQFDTQDANRDGSLDAAEFPHPGGFKGVDGDQDGKLTRDEHLAIFRSQFPGLDSDKDGVLTAADRKKRPGKQKAPAKKKQAAGKVSSRPHIVFILSDDHARHALSCYGNTVIQTPGLDRIAAEGMRFTHALAPNSFCTPARAAVLTGKYSHKNGVTHLNQKFDGSQSTFPKLLQAAGYETSLFGKWHLLSRPTGFDHFCVMRMQGAAANPLVYEPQHNWLPWKADGWNKVGRKLQGYNVDVITDEAIGWIKGRGERDPNKPFCLLLHPKPPHEPYSPAPRHADYLADVTVPEPANLLDDYRGRTPEAIADIMRPNRIFLKPNLKSLSETERKQLGREKATRILYQEYIKGYYRLVKALDENIVKLLDFLDESGLAENTLVVYTSDQGFSLGEHGFYNKQWMYEEPLHQPLLIRYPGRVKPGQVHESMVNHVDLAPTLLDLVGLPVPQDMQGYSLKPILEGSAERVRDASYYHFYSHGKSLPEMIGVRTPTHKLIHYPGMEGNYRWEMFDLERDPTEMNNLAHGRAHQALRTQLAKQLQALADRLEDEVHIPGS